MNHSYRLQLNHLHDSLSQHLPLMKAMRYG